MIFPSKILLFGEYCIIQGSKAMAIPFNKFFGQWTNSFGKHPDQRSLYGLLEFLKGKQIAWLDLQQFEADLHKGRYFKANIPVGYGVGSSGALSAAVYSAYSIQEKKVKLSELKIKLAEIESYFHGASSGIDPLVSYLNKPVCIDSGKEIHVLDHSPKLLKYHFFLLDTGIARKTEPLVKKYLDYCKDDHYLTSVKSVLMKQTDNAIQSLIHQDEPALFKNVDNISQYQLKYLRPMILDSFIPIWKKSLDGDLFRLKLCGAGGGGFFLGMTSNLQQTQVDLQPHTIIEI